MGQPRWTAAGNQIHAWPTVTLCGACGEEHGKDRDREIIAHLPPESPHGALIAAAPELLAAAKLAKLALPWVDPASPGRPLEIIASNRLRAAIAKAEGSR